MNVANGKERVSLRRNSSVVAHKGITQWEQTPRSPKSGDTSSSSPNIDLSLGVHRDKVKLLFYTKIKEWVTAHRRLTI